MTKVITYGTYDLLHYGHVKLLERAKALGDYLIVGVTSDDYDKTRGKINNQQSLAERIAAVKALGIADEIIVEEYEGQKIDDIQRYDVDIFTVGSDWKGKFDYLEEYCRVIYLPRTEGVSSSDIRSQTRRIRLGLIGDNEGRILNKYCNECQFVNGAVISGVCSSDSEVHQTHGKLRFFTRYEDLLDGSDAVYILSNPAMHYQHIKQAVLKKKHVLVELPVALKKSECEELFGLADKNQVVIMPAMKTAYAMAYNRLLLLLKSGKIGKIVSVDATCTSIREISDTDLNASDIWNSICAWGPTAMLPVFHLFGTDYKQALISSYYLDKAHHFDGFTQVYFIFEKGVATIRVGRGAKSEGELIVTGTKGYIYVPAPWWKTDYYEVRYENSTDNRRYYYQLDGEGIRYELVAFIKAIEKNGNSEYISRDVAMGISAIIEEFYKGNVIEIL